MRGGAFTAPMGTVSALSLQTPPNRVPAVAVAVAVAVRRVDVPVTPKTYRRAPMPALF